ncbi:SIS domain-containing protein [candidate division KSB1 bacterium]|nr:SIS domain-containing protein [candidate division KSB1 bacterium]
MNLKPNQLLDNDIKELITEFNDRNPLLIPILDDILAVYQALVHCYEADRVLYICGNGGSYADSIHIAGELMKSFARKRPVPEKEQQILKKLPFGEELSGSLEAGFRAIPLGLNISLTSALENDISQRYLTFAQELYILGRKGDVLMGISTSGNAKNVAMAMTVAKLKEMTTIGLTGMTGGTLAKMADLTIRVPATQTPFVQEFHLAIYHLLCAMVEANWFKIKK